jgi:hypothetical protein
MSNTPFVKADFVTAGQNSSAGEILNLLQDALGLFRQHPSNFKMSDPVPSQVMEKVTTNYRKINCIINTDPDLFEVGNEAIDSLHNKIKGLLREISLYFKGLPPEKAVQFQKVVNFFNPV